MKREIILGLDAGSVALKTVAVDCENQILFEDIRRTHGRPFQAVLEAVRAIEARLEGAAIGGVGVTGTGGQKMADLLGGRFTNEIIAQSMGLAAYAPRVRTAIEMGGQDSKLLLFKHDGPGGQPLLSDFSMNSLCAAGTGSFLDQQAAHMGVAIEEEFGRLALDSQNPPRIAGRCSVFAKSDMIHLQQIATPLCDIAAGLCLALARSFKATVGKGKAFALPIAFMGGVAANAGMVRAFESILGLAAGELVVPPHFRTLGAIGAALRLSEGGERACYQGLAQLEAYLENLAGQPHEGHEPLRTFLSTGNETRGAEGNAAAADGKTGVYLGIDVGSMTTKVVAIDEQNRVLAKRYLPTATRPIEAVRRALLEVGDELEGKVEVRGVGTTGSGRVMIGQLVGADVIRNEITAQATAAMIIDPEVDTIFEIGGQDSKYISIDHGVVCNFEMNKACAAGTGSFLEEQAERLGVDLESEFNGPVLDAPQPVRLGDRCTVFMESDLVHHQQQGAATRDLLAGLAYSIVHNYLNRVVGDRRIGERIFFQGGTAFNKAVVAAFNAVLGRQVTVPPHHEVTGAIGAALLARGQMAGPTRFRGFDFSRLKYDVSSFMCKSCANQCEIRQVNLAGEKPFFYGSRCEKFEVDRHGQVREDLPDLFAERERLLLGTAAERSGPASRGRVGIPRALLFHEFLPFWRAFFEALGFEVVLSAPTSGATVAQGVEAVVAEVCLPIKVAHGHLLNLAAQKPDFIFLPCLVDSPTEDSDWRRQTAYNCPWVQSIPYTASSAIDFKAMGVELFQPALHMQRGLDHLARELGASRGLLRAGGREIRRALERAQQAQQAFRVALEARGREILAGLDERQPALVIVGRAYNSCDPGMNLNLARKLRTLGVLPIPLDMLPLSESRLDPHWSRMYWRSGQRILKAARSIRSSRNLFGVYVSNFSCGPDSFLLEFFREEMAGKPHLLLEIDEHSADAGLITRCEAFLDTLRNIPPDDPRRAPRLERPAPRQYTDHRRIFMPNMAPQARPLAAAMRACGVRAEVMEPSDEESARLGGRHTSGKECYPCQLTTGDMLRQARRGDFDPDRSAFVMCGSDGPCRLGQYTSLHRRILDKAGLEEVPILSLEQDRDFTGMEKLAGSRFPRLACQGIFAVDVLEKLLLRMRPYEAESGSSDAWFWQATARVDECIERGGGTFWRLMEALAAGHRALPRRQGPRRPLVGLVGEMYVRTNTFANDNLVRRVEALGGEVTLPPWSEWIHYLRHLDALNKRAQGRWPALLGRLASHTVMLHLKRRIYAIFGLRPEPAPTELFRQAAPYVDASFEGETVLTIGKSLELIREEGASGIINAMPFTCMPGTVCAALFKRVREENGEFPVLSLAYAGQQSAGTQARLEAFMYQVRQYRDKARTMGESASRAVLD